MSNWDFGFTDPTASRRAPWEPPPDGPADTVWEETDTDPYPLTFERGREQPGPQPPVQDYEPWPRAPFPGGEPLAGQIPADGFAGGELAGQAGSAQFTGESWLHAPASRQPAEDGPSGWPGTLSGGDRARGGQDAPTRVWPAPPGTGRAARSGEQSSAEFGDGFDGTRGAAGQPGGFPGDEFDGGESGGQQWLSDGGSHDRGGTRRWMILAGVAAAGTAVGVSAVLLSGGHPAAPVAAPSTTAMASHPAAPAARHPAASPKASPARQAPITLAQAQGVLAGYTSVNNSANAQRSAVRLATIEAGSSYAIDTGLYREQQAAGVAPYPAFGPVRAAYYIPRAEPAGGPRWFAVQVANSFFSSPGKVTSTEYLLFTQTAPGGPWQNAVEPYVLPGAGTPQIAVGPDGLATAVSPAAASLAVAPGQLAARTAESLDGTGTGQAGAAVTTPSTLADQSDQRFWRAKLPTATVTDTHTPATGTGGQEFALLTTDGGALVFYTDAAELTITPPAGTMLHLTVPSLYSPTRGLTRAGLTYLDQFAAYDPPANTGTPRVVAGYSGLTGKN